MTDIRTQEFVKEHPKLLGVLFGLAILSTHMGSAMGMINGAHSGP